MPLSPLLLLFVLLLVAYVSWEVCRWLKIPCVLGQISAGLILGIPVIRNALIGPNETLVQFLAQIGIVLLFFYVGMEVNLAKFQKSFREAAFISIFNTAIPFVLGLALARLVGLDWIVSSVLALSLSVSAVAVSVDFLAEERLLQTKLGRMVIAAGAVDDLFELFLISIVLAIVQATITGLTTVRLLADVGIFLLILVFFKLVLIPWLLRVFERDRSHTALFAGALIITLLLAGLAELFGISSFIGALLAGLIVRQVMLAQGVPLEEQHLANNIKTIAFGFFVPIFTLWIGMNTNVNAILQNWPFAIAITLIATFGTVLGSALGVHFSGGKWTEGLAVGFGVNAKGDVELAIATIALQSGIIGPSLFSAVVFMSIATTLLSPLIFKAIVERQKIK